ncbi:hypothetical protein CHS0354_042715 [Potamilus streckersoni]|uniref:Uncharacterized protein n=1 Tax=Potamilus streckersoni TaxID=2493646 RepID=A0AAE0S9E5_9BIVA|nr:hypothetical protein CHS0354_042715 [Potamilus streckersoni]
MELRSYTKHSVTSIFGYQSHWSIKQSALPVVNDHKQVIRVYQSVSHTLALATQPYNWYGATYTGVFYAQKIVQNDGNIILDERDCNEIQGALSQVLEQRATAQTKEVRIQIEDSDSAPNETADQLRSGQVWAKFLSPIKATPLYQTQIKELDDRMLASNRFFSLIEERSEGEEEELLSIKSNTINLEDGTRPPHLNSKR